MNTSIRITLNTFAVMANVVAMLMVSSCHNQERKTVNSSTLLNQLISKESGLSITRVGDDGQRLAANDPNYNYSGQLIIKFHDQNIYQSNANGPVNFTSLQKIDNEKVVLMETLPGGSGCFEEYRIITIQDDQALVSKNIGNCHDPIITRPSDSEIQYSFYDGYGKRIITSYKNHQLTESRVTLPLHYDAESKNNNFYYLQKYASNQDLENIFIDSKLAPQLDKMMRKSSANLKDRLQIAEAKISGGYLIISGAMAHSFGSDQAFLAIALDGSAIYSATLKTIDQGSKRVSSINAYSNRSRQRSMTPPQMKEWFKGIKTGTLSNIAISWHYLEVSK